MNLGIFLSSGESFKEMAKSGQEIRFKIFYLRAFAKRFKKVYVFSYENEKIIDLPTNIEVIPNRYNLHRFLYGILMPFLNFNYIQRCDVFRSYHILGTLPALVTKIFFRKPFVFNYGYDYIEFAVIEKRYFQILLLKLISPIACLLADKIIAGTKMVLDWTPKHKTIFIPNGVDINVFKPNIKKPKRRVFKLLNVGRLETQKNQINLIKALPKLKADLVIIGNGSLQNALEKTAKKLNVSLTIISKVENTRLPEIYRKADIFILPSLTEGPVKVLIEAMACGLPVIGSDVRGINEIIIDGQNGLLCSTNAPSIRKIIQRLMNDDNLIRKLSSKSRTFVVENFNLDKLLIKEINTIKSIYHD